MEALQWKECSSYSRLQKRRCKRPVSGKNDESTELPELLSHFTSQGQRLQQGCHEGRLLL